MNKSNTLVLDKFKKTVNRGVGMIFLGRDGGGGGQKSIKVLAKHKFSTIPLKKFKAD